MQKRAGWLGRAGVIAVVSIAFGLGGAVGQSAAQGDMKKGDAMQMDDKTKTGDPMQSADKMKTGDTMKKGEMKGDMKGDMKPGEMKKDDKMMMEKKP